MTASNAEWYLNSPNNLEALLVRSVTLSNSQIKGLALSPVEVVPAPGDGKLLLFLKALLIADSRAGAYTLSGGDFRIGVEYDPSRGSSSMMGGGSVYEDINEANPLISDGNTDRIVATLGAKYTQGGDGSELDAQNVENLGIVVFSPDGGTTITGGHADNTLTVKVFYVVVEL